ncbi:hypothetical protein H9P43_005762 [Blastocladiella emersonii ATCC 22665]|nr:hypothetical protein H9P43_005762 [Blastocladiella emersonii ATCC 22665]
MALKYWACTAAILAVVGSNPLLLNSLTAAVLGGLCVLDMLLAPDVTLPLVPPLYMTSAILAVVVPYFSPSRRTLMAARR